MTLTLTLTLTLPLARGRGVPRDRGEPKAQGTRGNPTPNPEPRTPTPPQVLISYIDVSDGREARRNVLSKHYGFECRCDRCKLEQRASLKSALKQSQDRRR